MVGSVEYFGIESENPFAILISIVHYHQFPKIVVGKKAKNPFVTMSNVRFNEERNATVIVKIAFVPFSVSRNNSAVFLGCK